MKPFAAATPDQVRETLKSLADEGRMSLATLSRLLGRPPRYLTTFVRGAGAEQLTTVDRELLAQFFRVDPRSFGNREECEA